MSYMNICMNIEDSEIIIVLVDDTDFQTNELNTKEKMNLILEIRTKLYKVIREKEQKEKIGVFTVVLENRRKEIKEIEIIIIMNNILIQQCNMNESAYVLYYYYTRIDNYQK